MATESESDSEALPFAPWQRLLISIGIIIYLLIVLLGPLSNPVASDNLTGPLSQTIAPVHQSLFLGHGYRFFGPDPSPSHIVEYHIEQQNGEPLVGRFPDPQTHWPRLLYHRWFMLSETIFEDRAPLLDDSDFKKMIDEMNSEITNRRMRSESATVNELILQRDLLIQDHKLRKSRTHNLLQQLANHLLAEHNGQSVEIFLRERLIPTPAQVASRIQLTDARFLSEPRSLGRFRQVKIEELETIK